MRELDLADLLKNNPQIDEAMLKEAHHKLEEARNLRPRRRRGYRIAPFGHRRATVSDEGRRASKTIDVLARRR